MSFFCVFFPLWDNIYPYTYRGASIISNRPLVPEHILFDGWADWLPFERRRSGLRQERTFSLSQMSRTELARVMQWRENEGWNPTKNKMITRKWKMAGCFLLHSELYYNGLITDWSLSNRKRRCCKNEFCNTSKTRINMNNSNYFTITFCPLMT